MGRPKKNGPPAGFSAIKPLERSQFDLEEGENTICVYEARRKGTSQKTGRPYDTIDIRIEGEANFMFVRSMLAGLLDNCDPPLEGGETLWIARGTNDGIAHTYSLGVKPPEDDAPF